jgi:predicted dehydrogenase
MVDLPRVVVVGAGIRGGLYARALDEGSGGMLVGLTDVDPAVGRRLAERFDVPFFPTIDELLHQAAPTAVIIATPDFAHREGVLAAASAGLCLMVEKPLAMSVPEATEMARAVAAGGARCMVAFENRWNPRFVAARAARDTVLGDVRHQIIHLNDTRWVPTQMLSWAARSSPGWFLMPHSLDIALWMADKPVASVYATGTRGLLDALGVETWDAIDALLTFVDGTSVTLHSGWVLPGGYPSVYDFRYEAVGSAGALRIEAANQGVSAFGERHEWLPSGTYQMDGKLCGFPVDMVNTFVRMASGENVSAPDVQDGLVVTRIVAAIHSSIESGASIAVGGP